MKTENRGVWTHLEFVDSVFEEDVERWSDFSALATPLSRSRTQEDFTSMYLGVILGWKPSWMPLISKILKEEWRCSWEDLEVN